MDRQLFLGADLKTLEMQHRLDMCKQRAPYQSYLQRGYNGDMTRALEKAKKLNDFAVKHTEKLVEKF